MEDLDSLALCVTPGILNSAVGLHSDSAALSVLLVLMVDEFSSSLQVIDAA